MKPQQSGSRNRTRPSVACSLLMLFAWTAPGAQPAQSPRAFTVPAQELGMALAQLGRDSGREIILSSDLVRGRYTSGIASAASVEQALDLLLAGTGLEWRINDAGTIFIEAKTAQGEPPTGEPRAIPFLEEIMVTAQRRQESGKDVSVAVTAFGADSIEALRLERLRDISRVTPGLLVSSFSQSSPTIAIRGASNTFTQIGANKPVAVVVDDVFVPRNSAADFDLFGLTSVQVLRGPQGTLFGRNVTGGAILIDSGRPEFGEFSARARGTLGDYSARALEGGIDAPLGESAAFRVSGSLRERDGYGRDRLTGREQDDQDNRAARAQARMRLAPSVEVLLSADYSDDEDGGRTLSSIGPGDDGDRRTSELGISQGFTRTQKGGSARLFWDVGGGTLTAISALRKSDAREIYSNVGASYLFLTGTQSQLVTDDSDEVRAFSQEIRYASRKWEAGDFIAGLYYVDEDASRLLGTQAFAAQTGAIVSNQLADQAVDSRSMAVFADGTVHLPMHFELTAGLRYTHDRKVASLIRTDRVAPRNNFAATDLRESWGELTPRAILSWVPSSALRAYASFSRGYTAGGYNTDAATLTALVQPFNPETVRNHEIGAKSDWFDGRLRVNASAFRMKYEDKQELFFNNLTRILTITNAARATSEGAEVEVRLIPSSWLTLNASYARLETQYDEFVIPGGAVFTGNPLSTSPRDKASLAASFSVPVGAWSMFATAMYSSTSSYFTGASADPNLRVPSYDLVNLSIGVEPVAGPWSVTAFVRNLTDTEYLLTPSTQTVRAEYLGEPRTVGISLTWSF